MDKKTESICEKCKNKSKCPMMPIYRSECSMFEDKDKKINDMWLPLFMAMLTMGNQPDNRLEKEIAYLHGKVDTLEKIVGGANE